MASRVQRALEGSRHVASPAHAYIWAATGSQGPRTGGGSTSREHHPHAAERDAWGRGAVLGRQLHRPLDRGRARGWRAAPRVSRASPVAPPWHAIDELLA